MTTEFLNTRPSHPREVIDSTFDNLASPSESKYIVKAVGEVLLEIQKFITSDTIKPGKSRRDSPKRAKVHVRSAEEKRSNFRTNKTLSDHELNSCIYDINEPTTQTYHRRVLDSPTSKHKKPLDAQNGSLKWKEIESNKFSVHNNETKFHGYEIESEHSLGDVCIDNFSCRGNVYSINRAKLSISTFVASFYKHYPIVSYSSFVLSLIYIDRFIKSQCAGDLRRLAQFNMTR